MVQFKLSKRASYRTHRGPQSRPDAKRDFFVARLAERGIIIAMKKTYKPEGYNSASPYLIVDGADRTIQFLKEVFGAVELRRFPADNGKLMHAEVRIDDSVVMLADPAPSWPAMTSHVHVYVSDVDGVYRRALQAGAVSVQEPVKKEDEDKRGGVKDAGGTTWWISTRVG